MLPDVGGDRHLCPAGCSPIMKPMTDTIVAQQEIADIPGRGRVNLLHFHQGMVLMISREAVGLYRNRAAVTDPLGNGVIGYQTIPEPLRGEEDAEQAHVTRQTSGYVGLTSGAVLFIRPDGIGLYPDNNSALNNRDRVWLIHFEPAA